MDEVLFTGIRWQILEQIAQSPRTTTELAGLLNTSSANISQQLRQLELAGIIKKIRSNDARRLNVLSKPMVKMISLQHGMAKKDLFYACDNNFLLLSLIHSGHTISILNALLSNIDLLEQISALAVLKRVHPELFVITSNVDYIRAHHTSITADMSSEKIKVAVWSHTFDEVMSGIKNNEAYFKQQVDDSVVLRDPEGLFDKIKELREMIR